LARLACSIQPAAIKLLSSLVLLIRIGETLSGVALPKRGCSSARSHASTTKVLLPKNGGEGKLHASDMIDIALLSVEVPDRHFVVDLSRIILTSAMRSRYAFFKLVPQKDESLFAGSSVYYRSL
jgi:hypothetical protein